MAQLYSSGDAAAPLYPPLLQASNKSTSFHYEVLVATVTGFVLFTNGSSIFSAIGVARSPVCEF
jgi:hypothetical protein